MQREKTASVRFNSILFSCCVPSHVYLGLSAGLESSSGLAAPLSAAKSESFISLPGAYFCFNESTAEHEVHNFCGSCDPTNVLRELEYLYHYTAVSPPSSISGVVPLYFAEFFELGKMSESSGKP